MPPKKPPTQEGKRKQVRQEGRIGILLFPKATYDAATVDKILRFIEFQWTAEDQWNGNVRIYGYCELFEQSTHGKINEYTVRADFSEHEPIIELFKR